MIGAKLRQLRIERKYTLRQLSQKSGISHNYICDVEHGRSEPSLAKLRLLASALEVSEDVFFKDPDGAAT
jgi:transcriptional regulator with XRE-family HTH domain